MGLELTAGSVDLDQGVLQTPSGRVGLTERECALLRYMSSYPGEVISRDRLQQAVFGFAPTVISRAVDTTMLRLRAKIELDPSEPTHLLTVFGGGYRFLPIEPESASRGLLEPIDLDGRVVDLARGHVRSGASTTSLTSLEIRLLTVLLRRPGVVHERGELTRQVWDGGTSRGALKSIVHRIRRKLEPDPQAPRFLLTVRGGGLRLVVPRARAAAPLGRSTDLERLREAIALHQVCQLVGFGGVGKSALARCLPDARWCDLTGASDAEGVREAVRRAVCVTPTDQTIADALRAMGSGVLVLDGAEDGAAHLSRLLPVWLGRAPSARCVITSRRRIPVERSARVLLSPLSVAPAHSSAHELARCPAVRLFRERASLAGVELEDGDLPDVRAIVDRLDGVPGAIEIAASRAPALAPKHLRARLEGSFEILDASTDPAPRGSPEEAVRWSWSSLEPSVQRALGSLAVSPGAFRLQIAELLIVGSAIHVLQTLVEAGIVERVGERFRILHAIREHVLGEMSEWGQLDDARVDHARAIAGLHPVPADQTVLELPEADIDDYAHAARVAIDRSLPGHVLPLVLGAARAIRQSRDEAWLAGLLRGALDVEGLTPEAGWRLTLALCAHAPDRRPEELARELERFEEFGEEPLTHLIRGRLQAQTEGEGLEAFRAAARGFECRAQWRGESDAYHDLGVLLQQRGRLGEALVALEHAQNAAIRAGSAAAQARAMNATARVRELQGRLEEALEIRERAVRLSPPLDVDLNPLAISYAGLGRLEEARAVFDQALANRRQRGSARAVGQVLTNLTKVAFLMGSYDESVAYGRQALACQWTARTSTSLAMAHGNLAAALRQTGDLEAADHHAQRAIERFRAAERQVYVGNYLTLLARIRAARGMPCDELLEESHAILERIGLPLHLASHHAARAELELDQGRPSEAQRHIDRVLELARQTGLPDSSEALRSCRALERRIAGACDRLDGREGSGEDRAGKVQPSPQHTTLP